MDRLAVLIHQVQREKKMQDSEVERAKNVALHYNARPELGREDRKRSDVFQLKALNNWIKSVLIAEATSETRATRVLDLCCGKGGDLVKWSKAPTIQSLVGVDIADVSVEQATKRFKDMRFVNYKANFLAADVFAVSIISCFIFRGDYDGSCNQSHQKDPAGTPHSVVQRHL